MIGGREALDQNVREQISPQDSLHMSLVSVILLSVYNRLQLFSKLLITGNIQERMANKLPQKVVRIPRMDYGNSCGKSLDLNLIGLSAELKS